MTVYIKSSQNPFGFSQGAVRTLAPADEATGIAAGWAQAHTLANPPGNDRAVRYDPDTGLFTDPSGDPLASGDANRDIIVYGANPGGIEAAVAAARLGLRVWLLSETSRLGGIQGWGITQTDVSVGSTPMALNGAPKEFFSEVGRKNTNLAKVWQRYHRNSCAGFPSWFIRGWQERVAREKNINVIFGCVDPVVMKNGTASTTVTVTQNGARRSFIGAAFADASVMGDLARATGITMTIGREALALYGESLAGIKSPAIPPSWNGQSISPYVISGNSGSGLLPNIDAAIGTIDSGDGKLMAWTRRMLITTNAADQVPFPRPDPARYAALVAGGHFEALGRAMQAAPSTLNGLGKLLQIYPNKVVPSSSATNIYADLNGRPGVTTNYHNSAELLEYVTAPESRRAVIRENILQWVLSLIEWIKYSGDSRIPAALISGTTTTTINSVTCYDNINLWGLCASELKETGGMTPETYIRTGPRMVGDFVMNQSHVAVTNGFTDEIAFVQYDFDAPQVRLVNDAGTLKQEGSQVTALTSAQYGAPIPYRVLVPKASESTNTLVIYCPSVSEVVLRAIRLEATYMQKGQAAGIALALKVLENTTVQNVDVAKLKKIQNLQELTDGVIVCTDTAFVSEGTVTYSGSWADDATLFGAIGPTRTGKSNGGVTTKTATFAAYIRVSGPHRVRVRYTPQALGSGPTNVTVTQIHADGTTARTINMEYPGGNGGIEDLGVFVLRSGGGSVTSDTTVISCTGVTGNVVPCAVEYIPI